MFNFFKKGKSAQQQAKVEDKTVSKSLTDFVSGPSGVLSGGIISGKEMKKSDSFVQSVLFWENSAGYKNDLKNLGLSIEKILKDDVPVIVAPSKSSVQSNNTMVNESFSIEDCFFPNVSIVLIDDSPTIRKYVGDLLGKNDFDVLTKNDGAIALQYFLSLNEDEIPDLIISDMEMPNMNGDELVRNLRKIGRYQDVPILIISAHAERHIGLMEDSLINGFMHKPFDNNEFIKQVNYLLGD